MSATTSPIIIREGFNKLWTNQIQDENKTNYSLKQRWLYSTNVVIQGFLSKAKKHKQLPIVNSNFSFVEFPSSDSNNFISEISLPVIKIQRIAHDWRWVKPHIHKKIKKFKIFRTTQLFKFILSKLISLSITICINTFNKKFLFPSNITIYNLQSVDTNTINYDSPTIKNSLQHYFKKKNRVSTLRVLRAIQILNIYQNIYALTNQFAFEIEKLVSERHIHVYYLLRNTLQAVKKAFKKRFDNNKKMKKKLRLTTPKIGTIRLNLLGRLNRRARTCKIELLEPNTVSVHKHINRIDYQHSTSLARIGIFGSRIWHKL